MAWPKGKARGPWDERRKQDAQSRLVATARDAWANPEKRARIIQGQRRSWNVGKRAGDRVAWSPEMDAELIRMRHAMKFSSFRAEAAKRLGVSDGALLSRVRYLDLVDPVISRRTAAAIAYWKQTSPSRPVAVSPSLPTLP